MKIRKSKLSNICILFLLNFFICFGFRYSSFGFSASEVLEDTHTKVAVRNHPRTGIPFVSITAEGNEHQNPFSQPKTFKRPDYRMLDAKTKSGDIPYDGPVSDRKKVYILAASLATVGTVGGVGIIAVAPAATGTGAAGGAGLYGAAGTAVAAGSVSSALASQRTNPEKVNFTHRMKAQEVKKKGTGF